MLPDFLRLIASNIRSGMTPFQALKLAARPEFGPLKDEVDYITIRGLGNENFQDLVVAINKHIRSESLDRALKLFSSTLKSGGHLAQVLEESTTYIEEKRRLKKELSTITKSYSVFIMFSVVILAPFLLSISIQFLTMVTAIQSITKGSESIAGFGGQISITVGFLRICALIFLVATGIFSSMLVAVIKQEKIQYGFKYALLIVSLSLVSFFIANNVIKSMFAS
ncbi:MAG: type II secretion system F family protein [Nanoarchaeota archaeon]